MRKLAVCTLVSVFAMAGSALAASGKIASAEIFGSGGPTTTNNDDSCDISVAPAATLLLPYFEVDLASAAGETTLFTITNTSNLDQIAHVTLWTDLSFPVVNFNIYLTGYDVQTINLFDVISRGVVAPDLGTGTAIPTSRRRTPTSDVNTTLDLTACGRLPGTLTPEYVTRMQRAFTQGSVPDVGVVEGCDEVGLAHANAIGYATIDTADLCSTSLPTDAAYFTSEIRFDNVLIGDYQQVNLSQNFAQGNPMVHIRAIPEGGDGGTVATIHFDRTFYSRYQHDAVVDRRQPLPSVFAARWIQGGPNTMQTYYTIWREGATGVGAPLPDECGELDENLTSYAEIVRFDERENPVGNWRWHFVPPVTPENTLPETSRTSVADASVYPQLTNGATAGWIYLNLDNSTTDTPLASQNWVVVSMRAEGRYSVEFDAAWLANGCTFQAPISEVTTGTAVLGPYVATTPVMGPRNANWNPVRP